MMIQIERLTIRFIKGSDWESLINIWTDFGNSDYSQYDAPHSLDEFEVKEKVRRWAEVSPRLEHIFFAVLLDGAMIGYVDFHKNAEGYELGYCFNSRYHGQGYAKESISALIDWLSSVNGDKVCFVAGTALENTPSVKLLKSLGFEQVKEENVSFYQNEDGSEIVFRGGVYLLEKFEDIIAKG